MGELSTSLLSSPREPSRPRVEWCPPSVRSDGDVAIQLAKLAGLELDQWQQDALVLMLGRRADDSWSSTECVEIVARQNGKGTILEARVLAGLFLFKEQLQMWSAHEYRTALEAFLRVRTLIDNLAEEGILGKNDVKISTTHGSEGLTLATGQRLKFIARSKSSGRGFSGDLVILDEAFALTRAQHSALLPTLSARKNPQILYTSSPPLDGDSGEVMFSLRSRALAGGDVALGYRDWGADGDLDHLAKIDLGDRETWAATNPALNIRITEDTIAREYRSMNAVDFARERLGIWPKQRYGEGVIDTAAWAKLLDADSRRSGDIALAVDISPKRDYACIGFYGLRDDGVGHVQLMDYRPGTDWLVGRIEELRTTLNPIAIAMGRGTGKCLETELDKLGITLPEDKDDPRRGDLAFVGGLDMSAACGQIIDAVRQADVRHIGQQPLDLAIAGARTRELTDTIAWARKSADADISPLVVITLARWVYAERAHLIQAADYDVLASVF